MADCRYCGKAIENDTDTTVSYWGVTKFPCHKACKVEGEKTEAYDCQVIDADCNDCFFFQRGQAIFRWLSCMDKGKPSKRYASMEITEGHCLKFHRRAIASPKFASGFECFVHRKDACVWPKQEKAIKK